MHWDWQGAAAVILALTLGGGYAAVLITSVVQGHALDSAALTSMNTLGGILGGALAGWLGGYAAGKKRNDDDQDGGPRQ